MPVKEFLSKEQKERLQKALRESDRAEVRERSLMLLLMNDGKTYQQISELLGCARRTVSYWCVHGNPDNLDSLRDKREKGNVEKPLLRSKDFNSLRQCQLSQKESNVLMR